MFYNNTKLWEIRSGKHNTVLDNVPPSAGQLVQLLDDEKDDGTLVDRLEDEIKCLYQMPVVSMDDKGIEVWLELCHADVGRETLKRVVVETDKVYVDVADIVEHEEVVTYLDLHEIDFTDVQTLAIRFDENVLRVYVVIAYDACYSAAIAKPPIAHKSLLTRSVIDRPPTPWDQSADSPRSDTCTYGTFRPIETSTTSNSPRSSSAEELSTILFPKTSTSTSCTLHPLRKSPLMYFNKPHDNIEMDAHVLPASLVTK